MFRFSVVSFRFTGCVFGYFVRFEFGFVVRFWFRSMGFVFVVLFRWFDKRRLRGFKFFICSLEFSGVFVFR